MWTRLLGGMSSLNRPSTTFRIYNLTLKQNVLNENFLLTTTSNYNFQPCCFRYKPKWAQNIAKTSSCQNALNHFDSFYKPVYGHKWPLVRISLLSLSKYSAVINKYADAYKFKERLIGLGTEDFVKKARTRLQLANFQTLQNSSAYSSLQLKEYNSSLNFKDEKVNEISLFKEDVSEYDVKTGQFIDPIYDELYKDNINVFVPTMRVLSEKDQLMRDELKLNAFEPRDIKVHKEQPQSVSITENIEAFVFSKGDVTDFPQPKSYNAKCTGYYLMDAASVMPVISLDIQPDDKVLDMCAAPGGKSMLIMQCLNMDSGGSLTCNDSSLSRLKRLRSNLMSYYPGDVYSKVAVLNHQGSQIENCAYNKVLVDAPCTADRHVLKEEDNNLFKPSRTRERLAFMDQQKKLLVSAIRCCTVGGNIVYSTCTLAPAQNDGVIQAAVEELTETTQIEVVIEDLASLVDSFSDTFTFFENSRFGQTILPSLSNNFGPMYFAKLRRIK